MNWNATLAKYLALWICLGISLSLRSTNIDKPETIPKHIQEEDCLSTTDAQATTSCHEAIPQAKPSLTSTGTNTLSVNVTVGNNMSCSGINDGKLIATISGGNPPYNYGWSNGGLTLSTSDTQDSISGLFAGTYSVTVSDDNGVTATSSGAISEPALVVLSIVVDSNVTCANGFLGGATGSTTGGTSPYTYTWSNSATSASITGVSAGTYSLTISDANGCTDSSSVTIVEENSNIASAVVVRNSSCFNDTDGLARASGSGGTAPYSYSWNTGDTVDSLTGYPAGTYSVTVTDANGCTDSSSVVITQPNLLTASARLSNTAYCHGSSTGAATAEGSWGTGSYTYLWSNNATTARADSLAAGTYSVTITDANGCTDSASVVVTESPKLVISSTVDNNISCNGLSDGGGTASVSGGSIPYTYSWSNGATTASFSGTAAGIYTVTITDAYGCSDTDSVTITEPALLIAASMVDSNISCNGLIDGGASCTGSGGTAPYTFQWSNSDTSASITGVGPGTYSVTITDNNGCTDSSSVTITEPAIFMSNAAVDSNATCNGFLNGGATATGSGGTTPYSYSWSNSATTASITGVGAGTYSVTVTDANGCTDSSSVVITQPSPLTATTFENNPAFCTGSNTGAATVNGSGGTGAYTFLWSNNATTTTITGVGAGTYSVTVTDANGCTDSSSVIITEPAPLIANPTVDNNISCNGLSDGAATASGSGGISPYTYRWSNGATTASFSGTAAGIYTVTISDHAGCTNIDSVTITEPAVLIATSVADNHISCNGLMDGSASGAASGGTAPYTFQWSNSDTSASITGVGAGTYSVTVTDNNGCTDSSSVTITEPAIFMSSAAVDSNATCNGFLDGGATAAGSGGTAPYSYSWSNTATTASITGVGAGTYSVTVSDANGCTDSSSVTIIHPANLQLSTVVDSNTTCNSFLDGGATAIASGGTPPYTYTWSNSAATASITGVAADTYSVTVSDANGCTSIASATITETTIVTALSVVDSNITCNGFIDGGITTAVSGGTAPYTFQWSNSATTASITGVAAGIYSVTVSDANGCTGIASATITEPGILMAESIVDSNSTCNGLLDGGATATASGGTAPYSYVWSNGATSASITGVAAGIYNATVTDANGCTSTTSTTITEPVVLDVSSVVDSNSTCNGLANGGATVLVTGGTAPYTYDWSNSATTASITGVMADTYSVTITDANGCTDVTSVSITEPAILTTTTTVDSSITCTGFNNGQASSMVTGGTMPYTYQWSDGTTEDNLANAGVGTYSVTITDANGCTTTDEISFNEPNALTASTTLSQEVSCFGEKDGVAEVLASGGTGAYTYQWSDADNSTTAIMHGAGAGSYTVTITDSLQCQITDTIIVAQPDALATTFDSIQDVVCSGTNTGQATIITSGGTMPYGFNWSDGTEEASNMNLETGMHIVTVMDANGCMMVDTLVLDYLYDSPILDLGPDIQVARQHMINVPNIYESYQWSNGANGATLIVNEDGTYTLTVTDANGCSATDSITVSILTTSLEELTEIKAIKLYPNPNAGIFTIETELLEQGPLNWKLFALDGRLQEQGRLQTSSQGPSATLDVRQQLSPGAYLLQLTSEKHTATIQVVIQ